MLSNLLHANIVRMPLVGYIPNYFMRNCVYLYLVTLLLHSIGNLIGNCSCFVCDECFAAVKREMAGRETSNLEVLYSSPICSIIIIIRG